MHPTPPRRHLRRLPLAAALIAALCAALPSAHAGRPLAVDDAGVDEVGHGHVEVWWEGLRGQRGTFYAAPAFTPIDGLELGALLARDVGERHTLQGVQAKWLWSPAETDGCNAASTAGVTHRRQAQGHSGGSAVALNLIGTCAAPWGMANATWARCGSAPSPGARPGASRWSAAGAPSLRM